MADENGIVVKPAIVKQDGNTTEIEIHIEKPAEPEREQTEAAEAAQDKRRKSLTEVLYKQIDILEREQKKIASGYEGSNNPKAARSENLAFAKQITETANAIISIKRRNSTITALLRWRKSSAERQRSRTLLPPTQPPTWTRSILSLKDFRRQSRMYRAAPQAGSRTVLTPWRVRV